jgi:8-oxo-dGTP pyrophosphatase MutT (NUDIX family)
MPVRDAPGAPGGPGGGRPGIEVLMVRRNLRSDFVGGAYVFPGGAVDPADGGRDAELLCTGRDDAGASAVLGVDSGGLAYWVAVLRECFEEAGLLLAYRPGGDGQLVSFDREDLAARFARHRREVNAGKRRFLDVCREEGLTLAVDRVHYFAHWITPEGAPRRYDTRFFVAAAPAGQTPDHDRGETIAARWIGPADALRLHRDGEIELIFPTIRNLQAISRFESSTDLIAAAAPVGTAGAVPTVLPRVVADGNGVRILLPGDEGYEQVGNSGAPPVPPGPAGTGALVAGSSGGGGAGPIDFNAAVRAISLAANREPPEGPREGPAVDRH